MFINELGSMKLKIKLGNKPNIIVNNTKGKKPWNSNSNISLEYFRWLDKPFA